jgi:hypothetical protein
MEYGASMRREQRGGGRQPRRSGWITALTLYGSPRRVWAALRKAREIVRLFGMAGLVQAVRGKLARPTLRARDMVGSGGAPPRLDVETRWTTVGQGLSLDHSVAVVVLTKGNSYFLRRLLRGLVETTASEAMVTVVVVNNGPSLIEMPRVPFPVAVINERSRFNWAAYNNRAVIGIEAEHLLFMNDDIMPLHGGWLDAMLAESLCPQCGVVGAKLLYPDGRIQHAGIELIWSRDTDAIHAYRFEPRDAMGRGGELLVPHEVAAVTGACMLTRRTVFQEIGGFDEAFAENYNDVDFCLKVAAEGSRCVGRLTPS